MAVTIDRAKLTKQRDRIRELVDHPATNPHLREVGQHKLDKLNQLLDGAREGSQGWTGYRLPEGWYGAKYDSKRSLTDVAKMIREEIKLTRKIGGLFSGEGSLAVSSPLADCPRGIKISVRQPHYGAIDITLKGVPREWGWEKRANHRVWGSPVQWMHTPALEALIRELNQIVGAYNYDRSDAMVDHFDVNFYSHVTTDWTEDPRD